MNRIVLLIGLIVIASSCKNKAKTSGAEVTITQKKFDKIERLAWIVGSWTNITPEQQSYESWKQLNDSTLKAYAYTTVLGDTVFQENMLVQQSSDAVVLIVSVPNQNDEKPVTFDLLPVEKEVFAFVNEQHDFPSKISYANPVKDSIHAWIEGKIDSTYKKIDFHFKRSN